jgi:hypothetical protein
MATVGVASCSGKLSSERVQSGGATSGGCDSGQVKLSVGAVPGEIHNGLLASSNKDLGTLSVQEVSLIHGGCGLSCVDERCSLDAFEFL